MPGKPRKVGPGDIGLTPRDHVGSTLLRWAQAIAPMPPSMRFVLSIALVVLVAALDYLTGSEISFSVFYLLPVSFAAGFMSRRSGWVIACLSAGTWGFLEITTGHGYTVAWIPWWNSAVRLGFFLLVTELIDQLKSAHVRERALSRTDPLTGIANSRVFKEYATRVIAQCRRSGRPFTISYVDLDHFKHVNDEFGHSEGDRLLKVAAGIIAEGLRETDIVARLGGDEFGILMPETGAEQARLTLERIAAALARDVEGRWAVGATFGAVTFSEPPDDVDRAVREADTLMYRGKEAGRGRILQATWPDSGADQPPTGRAQPDVVAGPDSPAP